MSFNTWFSRLTDAKNTWAARTTAGTEATIDGTGELPPVALLGQASIAITATATLTVAKDLAGSATIRLTATGALYVYSEEEPPPDDETELNRLPKNIIPASSSWSLVTGTDMYRSPLTGKTQTVGRGGERWRVTLTYRNLRRSDAATLTAWLAALRGQYGRVTLPDHAYVKRGALAVNLLVNGSGQTGFTLACDNGTASVTNAVRAGDMFELENRLYMIVADASTNLSGNVTLTFTPALNEAPADGATVELLEPEGYFLLADNRISWTYTPGGFTSLNSVDLIEDRH